MLKTTSVHYLNGTKKKQISNPCYIGATYTWHPSQPNETKHILLLLEFWLHFEDVIFKWRIWKIWYLSTIGHVIHRLVVWNPLMLHLHVRENPVRWKMEWKGLNICLRFKTTKHDKEKNLHILIHIFYSFLGLTTSWIIVFLVSMATMTITSLKFYFAF